MRRGYSLSELLLGLAILGILTSLALPPFVRMQHTYAVDRAARRIATAHAYARFLAVTRGTPVVLTIDAEVLAIQIVREDTPSWVGFGPLRDGVSLLTPSAALTFAPNGLALGVANATHTLQRGRAERSVVVSRLGRVRLR